MKQPQSTGSDPVHQTGASPIEFQSAGQSIPIEFTDPQLSPHAGSAPFWAFWRQSGWIGLLEKCRPHPQPKSNHHLTPVSKVLGFVQGLLCGAKKLTRVAYRRRDPRLPELLGSKRVASQSVRARFFQGFTSAGRNPACFRQLFGWCLQRLPSRPGGYTRLGTKPCLPPLLAGLSEVRLVAAFWLRAGHSRCANNVVGFFLDLWENLPPHLRVRVVRADSGFCISERRRRWEQLRLKFIVVARLTQPGQRLIGKETAWTATEVAGTEVAEVDFHEADWPADPRLILIRHRVRDKRGRAGGKLLFDCPGCLYQARVTNLPRSVKALTVWPEDNGRAACEGVIKELDAGYGLPPLACQSFWATEAALSLGVLAHNLVGLFERKRGWLEAVTLGSLRYWLFVRAGVISHPQGRTTIKLAVPTRERNWWRRLWDKLLSPYPNCQAVENRPPIT